MKKPSLNAEEKEAMVTAIGTLDCGSLASNRIKGAIKGKKAKRENDVK